MKPKDPVKALEKLSFRPGDQPGLFDLGGPVVVLLSDVIPVIKTLRDDFAEANLELADLKRDFATVVREGRGATPHKRGIKHVFPDKRTVDEDARILRACVKHGATYGLVIDCARLYSETNDVRYASWPAAIEVALLNDYQWLKAAKQTAPPASQWGEREPTGRQLAARVKVAEARRARDQDRKKFTPGADTRAQDPKR